MTELEKNKDKELQMCCSSPRAFALELLTALMEPRSLADMKSEICLVPVWVCVRAFISVCILSPETCACIL